MLKSCFLFMLTLSCGMTEKLKSDAEFSKRIHCPSEIEVALDLSKWLPSVKHALMDALLRPYLLNPLDQEYLSEEYLTGLGIFGEKEEVEEEIKRALRGKVADPQAPSMQLDLSFFWSHVTDLPLAAVDALAAASHLAALALSGLNRERRGMSIYTGQNSFDLSWWSDEAKEIAAMLVKLFPFITTPR